MSRTCKAFPLDLTCVASDPCEVHGCTDENDGVSSAGCYCDPERALEED